jgi:hypothetical protein
MTAKFWIAIISGALLTPLAQVTVAQSVSPEQPAVTSESSIPPEQQATKEQLKKLFEVMRLRQQFDAMMKMLPNLVQQQVRMQMQQMTAKMPGAKQMTPAQQDALDKLMKKYTERARTLYPADEMIDDAISVYQRHMNKQDVEAYINFFSSPPGQHFLDIQPVIMKEYMPIALNRTQQNMRQLNAEMAADLAEFEKSMMQAK